MKTELEILLEKAKSFTSRDIPKLATLTVANIYFLEGSNNNIIIREETIKAYDDIFNFRTAYSLDGLNLGILDRGIVEFLVALGLTKFEKANLTDSVASIGFNEKTQTWYGWSHRAWHGFQIGSKVSFGDCAYVPKDLDYAIKACLEFWDITIEGETLKIQTIDETRKYSKVLKSVKPRTNEVNETFLDIEYIHTVYSVESAPDLTEEGVLVELSNRDRSVSDFVKPFGKGEWMALTLDDAKQMAIDYANGVS